MPRSFRRLLPLSLLLAGLPALLVAGCSGISSTRHAVAEGEGEGEGEGGGEGEGEGEGAGAPDAGPADGGLADAGGVAADSGRPAQVTPPARCHEPPFPGVAFVRATDAWGIGRQGLAVDGIRVALADLDGDGYPDLLVHGQSNVREPAPAPDATGPPKHLRWVLMNRPSPADPAKRVFVDATRESGYMAARDGGEGRVAHLAVAGDVNNDGKLDLFSGAYQEPLAPGDTGDRSEILLNQGDGTFALGPAGAVATADPRPTTSAAFLDYDRDGNLDLFLGGFYGTQNELYRGHGDGTFERVTDAAGLTATPGGEADGTSAPPTYGVTACDVDGDGDPDLLVSAYGRQFNQLWINDGGHFHEVGRQVGFAGDALLDYSDNEFYHCYCATTHQCQAPVPRIDCSGGSWEWTPGVDDQPWRLNGNTFTTVCGDIDGDGDMDLLSAEIRHWHIGKSSDPTELLLSAPSADNGLGFTFERPGNLVTGLDRAWRAEDWNEGDITASFVDYDNDGQLDIYVGDSDYPGTRAFLWGQRLPGQFEETAVNSGIAHPWAVGHAWGDLDGDGDLDLVVASSTMRGGPWATQEVHVYENQGAAARNWLRVKLVGGGAGRANVAAIGARVTVATGVRRQLREVTGGYGHFGLEHDLTLHFGLGSTCKVDTLTVRWPDATGTVEEFHDVPANYHVQIHQGEGIVRYLDAP